MPTFLAVDVSALESSPDELPDELVVVDDFAADSSEAAGSSVDSLYAR